MNASSRAIFLKWVLPIALATIAVSYGYAWFVHSLNLKFSLPSIADDWCHWDAGHYLRIARQGYAYDSEVMTDGAFFPLYPMLIWCLHWIVGDYRWSALLISGFSFVLALHWLFELFQLDCDLPTTKRALLLLVLFPTAYFLHAAYPESLFIALSAGAFLFIRRKRYDVAGFLAMAACLTRPQGMALVPALVVECLMTAETFEERKHSISRIVVPAVVGFAIFLANNRVIFGSPFFFMHVQTLGWARYLDWPMAGLHEAWIRFRHFPYEQAVYGGGAEIAGGLVFLALAAYSSFRMRKSYCVYLVLIWLMIAANHVWMSQPRHLLTAFPIFIALAQIFTSDLIFMCAGFGFVLLQAFLLDRYVTLAWAF